VTGVSIITEKFSTQFVKCCPQSSISGNILRTSGQEFSMVTSTPVTICIMQTLTRVAITEFLHPLSDTELFRDV